MPPQAHARTAGVQAQHHVFELSRPPKQCIFYVKTGVNADMAKLVNLGAGMDLARGEKVDQLNNLVTFRAKYGCWGT